MSKPFDWMSHLGFEVQDAGGVPVINEEGDMREADLCHRVLRDEMVSLKAQRDALLRSLDRLTHYAECQVKAFSSGHCYLDMTLFPSLCKEAREAIAAAEKAGA